MNTVLTILGLAVMFGGIWAVGPMFDPKKEVKTQKFIPCGIDSETGDVLMIEE